MAIVPVVNGVDTVDAAQLNQYGLAPSSSCGGVVDIMMNNRDTYSDEGFDIDDSSSHPYTVSTQFLAQATSVNFFWTVTTDEFNPDTATTLYMKWVLFDIDNWVGVSDLTNTSTTGTSRYTWKNNMTISGLTIGRWYRIYLNARWSEMDPPDTAYKCKFHAIGMYTSFIS